MDCDEVEKFKLIDETIRAVGNNYALTILIKDCADKLALTVAEVEDSLKTNNSDILDWVHVDKKEKDIFSDF